MKLVVRGGSGEMEGEFVHSIGDCDGPERTVFLRSLAGWFASAPVPTQEERIARIDSLLDRLEHHPGCGVLDEERR